MPSPIRKGAFKRKLRRLGCTLTKERGKGSHFCAERVLEDGTVRTYYFPTVHGRHVKAEYVKYGVIAALGFTRKDWNNA